MPTYEVRLRRRSYSWLRYGSVYQRHTVVVHAINEEEAEVAAWQKASWGIDSERSCEEEVTSIEETEADNGI